MKHLTINSLGTYIDGLKISDASLRELNLNFKSDMILKLEVPDKAKNVGRHNSKCTPVSHCSPAILSALSTPAILSVLSTPAIF